MLLEIIFSQPLMCLRTLFNVCYYTDLLYMFKSFNTKSFCITRLFEKHICTITHRKVCYITHEGVLDNTLRFYSKAS